MNNSKMKHCKFCNKYNNEIKVWTTKKFGESFDICQNHYYQMNKYGKILRTRFDKNEIVEHEGYIEVFLYNSHGNKVGSTMISYTQRDLIDKYKICMVKDKTQYYAIASLGNGKNKRLHQIIAERLFGECPKGKTVDHKNINGLDNRDENISYKNYSEQQLNKRVSKNNSSGIKGVSQYSSNGKWYAEMKHNGKKLREGFLSLEEAINKRKEWEEMYVN